MPSETPKKAHYSMWKASPWEENEKSLGRHEGTSNSFLGFKAGVPTGSGRESVWEEET